jgi:hypothetical protein
MIRESLRVLISFQSTLLSRKALPATVYLVHKLRRTFKSALISEKQKQRKTYSEIRAALPRTVKSTVRYSAVPQNQCPESRPSTNLRSPQKRITENPNNILSKVSATECNIQVKTDQTMIQRISNPEPKRCFREKFIFLAKYIKLRVSIQNSCGHKLIENANYEGRKESENDIVH